MSTPPNAMTGMPGQAAQASTAAPGQDGATGAKVPEAQAGYMELAGAEKDGDCQKVEVQGGVSLDKGCCNLFEPQDEQVDQFKCGTCKYGSGGEGPDNERSEQGSGVPADHPLQQLRAKPKAMGMKGIGI